MIVLFLICGIFAMMMLVVDIVESIFLDEREP